MNNQTNPYSVSPHGVAVTGERAAQVLKNTYMLLGLSLIVATGASWFAMASNIGFVNVWLTLGVYFGLLFATNMLRNSAWGILAVFGLTGWLGFTTGPIINMYAQMPGGMEIVTMALAISAAFVLLSSMLILWQTSAIIHGGETNYIMATVTLFVSLYNLFMSLLHLLTALGGDD